MFDGHVHFIPPPVLQWLKEHPNDVDVRWEKRDPNKADFFVVEGKWAFELKEAFTNETLFLQEQEEAGVSHSLVSPVPQLFLYEREAAFTGAVAAVYNDALADWVAKHPDRLSALATVPLNDAEAAAAELGRAMERGLEG